MLVRPMPRGGRSAGRRPLSSRLPINETNRSLLRQFVRTRRSDPLRGAYLLEVREGPAVNGNTNAATWKSVPQPWVTVVDYGPNKHSIGLPVSLCDTLLKHLLSCANTDDTLHTDSSDDGDTVSTDDGGEKPESSKAQASGDSRSPISGQDSRDSISPRKDQAYTPKSFELSKLKPIRIVCEATGCTLELSTRDPSKRNECADDAEPTKADPNRRWLVSAPLETGQGPLSDQAERVSVNGRRNAPWESPGFVELYEGLLPQLAIFLGDVATRYRAFSELPEVPSLYSASGERRFFFDLRDTRWGKRLHISQVTDLHRNVIGIPLETLIGFRTRLDTIIQNLHLEDEPSNSMGFYVNARSPRVPQPRSISNDTGEVKEEIGVNGRKTVPGRGGQRWRERRRPRPGFLKNTRNGIPEEREMVEGAVSDSAAKRPERPMGNGYWPGGRRRFHRYPNSRSFNRDRRQPAVSAPENQENGVTDPPVQTDLPTATEDIASAPLVTEASA